jgi:hypothetical protein
MKNIGQPFGTEERTLRAHISKMMRRAEVQTASFFPSIRLPSSSATAGNTMKAISARAKRDRQACFADAVLIFHFG